MKSFLKKCTSLTFGAGLLTGAVVGTAVGQGTMGSSIFPDVPAGSYYDEAVGEMVALDIITGFGDGTFRPNEPLTRGQAAVLLKRIRDEIKGIQSSSSSSRSRRRSSSASSSSSTSSSSSSASSIPSAGLIRFTSDEYRFDENAATARVTVVRAGGNRGQVNVEYKLVADTATADADFESQEGTLMFESGETSTTFDITLKDDDVKEGNEQFTIELSNPTGGAGFTTPDTATIIIDDDETADDDTSSPTVDEGPKEGTFAYSATEYAIGETDGSVTIRVERRGGSKGSAAVDYDTQNGTANSNDYDSTSGTLEFDDGETEKSFTIDVSDNSGSVDGNKTVDLSLSNATNGAALHSTEHEASLTIHDEDNIAFGSGSIRFSDDEYEAQEEDGQAVITVRRVGGASGKATVKYNTNGGSATAGRDYTDVDDMFTFKEGEAAKTFVIPIADDDDSDGGETVTVRLQDVTGAGIMSPTQATLYIY